MDSKSILEEAMEIVAGARHEVYGEPAENHGCTAELWTAYLRRRLQAKVTEDFAGKPLDFVNAPVRLDARDVCMMMVLLKVSREAHWAQRDNLVDIAGYAANAEQCPTDRQTEDPPTQ